jgi:hypothetical protein
VALGFSNSTTWLFGEPASCMLHRPDELWMRFQALQGNRSGKTGDQSTYSVDDFQAFGRKGRRNERSWLSAVVTQVNYTEDELPSCIQQAIPMVQPI